MEFAYIRRIRLQFANTNKKVTLKKTILWYLLNFVELTYSMQNPLTFAEPETISYIRVLQNPRQN